MKVNMRALILDVEGDPMREPKVDKSNGEIQWEKINLDYTSLESAQSFGVRDALLDEETGKVIRRVPQMEEISLQRICVHALIRSWEGETLDDEQAFDRWTIARRLREELDAEGCIELEKEEREVIVGATDHYSVQNRIYFSRARELLGITTKFKKKPAATAPLPSPPNGVPPGMMQ